MNDHELLTQINGIGPETATELIDHFGHGHWVAKSACSYWGELVKVNGISKENARSMFHDMQAAGVFKELDGMFLDAIESGYRATDHGGGY